MSLGSRACVRMRCSQAPGGLVHPLRLFSATARFQDIESEPAIQPDPNRPKTSEILSKAEAMARSKAPPVGSRRSRMAKNSSIGLPFEQMPYQCFQEARQILKGDRERKLEQIATERKRIQNVRERPAEDFGGEQQKKGKLSLMLRHLERLKILADINDPEILRRFEDGMGDMNKPIYRHLADKKWRSYKRKVLEQRIEQMHVVPDLVPRLDLLADIDIAFGRHKVQPGEFVDSDISEQPPHLTVQPFDAGDRLVSVVVMDADVPNLETDGFDYRCHYLAANIPLSPTTTKIIFKQLAQSHVVYPWMPPHAQKGSPYHRLAVFVLQQPEGAVLDIEKVRERYANRIGFNLRSFATKYGAKPIAATIFRSVWDESTRVVMERNGLDGADIEFRPEPPRRLHFKYKVKDGERYR